MPYYDLNDPSGISFLDDATVSHGFGIGLNGVWGKVRDVVVTFTGLTHTFPADLDFVLLGPGGTNLEFWSDIGAGIDVTNANFTIGDFGVFAPEHTALSSGSIYRPTDYGAVETATNWDGHVPSGTVINHPGPIIGSATFASAFGG